LQSIDFKELQLQSIKKARFTVDLTPSPIGIGIPAYRPLGMKISKTTGFQEASGSGGLAAIFPFFFNCTAWSQGAAANSGGVSEIRPPALARRLVLGGAASLVLEIEHRCRGG
jgi:hypothetical protein